VSERSSKKQIVRGLVAPMLAPGVSVVVVALMPGIAATRQVPWRSADHVAAIPPYYLTIDTSGSIMAYDRDTTIKRRRP